MRQKKKTVLSRKQRRKEERRAKQERKKVYFLQKYSKNQNFPQNERKVMQKSEVREYSDTRENTKEGADEQPKQKRSSKGKSKTKKRILLVENKREDRIIKSLEKKMRLNKRKKKTLPQSFINDGLDYLLEVLDKPQEVSSEDENPNRVFTKPKKDKPQYKDSEMKSDSDEDEVDEDNGTEDEVEDEDIVELEDEHDNINQEETDNENASEDHSEEENDAEEDSDEEQEEDAMDIIQTHSQKFSNTKEDDAKDNLKKYPPRIFQGIDATASPLKRQLKGLFNRLSDANLQFVSNQIEELYTKNPRNDVNEAMANVILESILSSSLVPERLLMEQAVLLALLHGNIGTEIGAYFLQTLVIRLDSLLREKGKDSDDKACTNAIMFLAYMYAFKITHSLLIFNILQRLIDSLSSENEVDLIVTFLRTVGFNLRKDDSTSLREVILKLQSKVSAETELSEQSRVQFLLDVVKAIQNNNMHKVPNYDPTIIMHLQKVLHGLLRKGHYVHELRISLADLLDSNRKGRWWIVGSAWTESDTLHLKNKTELKDLENLSESNENFSEKVLELARKQRMNSDIRKKIFCIIMSAEDFIDAFEKLVRLGIKLHREVIHVVLDCNLQEKTFNPFYAHLLQKLSISDRHYQMALKFALWDKFKELKTMKSSQTLSLIRLLNHLLITDAMPITVFKAFHFSEMDKTLVRFLRTLFIWLFRESSEEACCTVFQRLSTPSPKLRLLREGLKLFLRHFLLQSKEPLL